MTCPRKSLGEVLSQAIFLIITAIGLHAATPEQQVREVLAQQQSDWNRGEVEAFMRGYQDSPSTTFVGKTVTKGFAGVLANYRKNYPSQEKMGRLSFSDVEVEMLGSHHASVIGKFHLDRGAEAGGNADGIFTLLFRKTRQGWKIILDHTS